MSKFKSQELLQELQDDVKKIIAAAEHIRQAEPMKLSYQPGKDRWSISQILEHLNAYNRHYLPLIEKAIAFTSKQVPAWFVSGYWGEKFTKSMKPSNVFVIKNKMKAMKSYCFPNNLNVEQVFNEFIEGNNRLLKLLETSKNRDLNEIRIPITLSKLVKLKLGDMFRFIVAHEQRHLMQARNNLHEMGIATDKFPVILQAVPQ